MSHFASPRQRIAFAKDDIQKFKRSAKAFFNNESYARVIEPHPDGIHENHKVKMVKNLPVSLTRTTVSCIENLRSALDQTGYATAAAAGAKHPKRTSFPFGDTEAYVKGLNAPKRPCAHLHPDIFSYFCSFKPYKGGNDLLWTLNRLCNTSKHWAIRPVGTALSSAEFRTFQASDPGGVITFPTWDGGKNEIIIATVLRGSKLKSNFRLNFDVTFGDVDPVSGEQVSALLNAFLGIVTGIVDGTEAEARRLGLIA